MRRICGFVLSLILLTALATGGLAWRLAQGPVDVSFLRGWIEAALNQGHGVSRFEIGGASIAWAGFHHGLDQSVAMTITDFTMTDPGGGRVHVPVAEASVSMRGLLTGRVIPRTIALTGARLTLIRSPDGDISFDLDDAAAASPSGPSTGSPLTALLAALAAPAASDLSMDYAALSQLSSVSIDVAVLRVDDRQLGFSWRADRAGVHLFRHTGGGVDGHATATLALGDQHPELQSTFVLAPGGKAAHVTAGLSPVTPKALAGLSPALAPLAALDAPLTLAGEADLAPDPGVMHFRLTARAGSGTIATGDTRITLNQAELAIDGTPDAVALRSATIEVRPSPGGPISTLRASGQLTRSGGRLGAGMRLGLDQAAFADLPALWPPDIGRPARAWITENITGGIARDGTADLVLDMAEDGSDLTLTKATATLDADEVVATWLLNVPAIERGKARLVLTDPDKMEIDVATGRQRVKGGDGLAIRDAHITLTGLSKNHQFAAIACDIAGSIPSALALLKEPRLRLLDKHPMELNDPAGEVRMNIRATVPLELTLTFDDVAIRGVGTLNKLRLSRVVAGRDLDDGTLAIAVDPNQLTLKGTAKLAAIPVTLDALMDFRAGGPAQVLQKVSLSGKVPVKALTEAGLDTAGALSGDAGLAVVLNQRRGGDGDLTIDADLTGSVLTVAPLAWRKPAGTAAKATARVRLSRDKLTGIEAIAVSGAGLDLRGAAVIAGGRVDGLRIERARLGRTDVSGTVRMPANGPIAIDATGPSLDLSAKLMEPAAKRPAGARPPPDPAVSLRGRFDRVWLAHDQTADTLAVAADYDGQSFRDLTATGTISGGGPFSARIAGGPGGRQLTLSAETAGRLLLGLDITPAIQGGRLSVTGTFDDAAPGRPLAGTAEMTDFRVLKAAALGKLLQALTLYGLVDALGGPGLSFDRLIAPFRLTSEALVLNDARAFSPSLGLTAKGQFDRIQDRMALEGTVVPAYVFNSLLGRIPLIGRLFTAEKGGGLIAVNYSLRGPTNDPDVMANPLSALTPGFLRGLFGLFDGAPVDPAHQGGEVQAP